MKNINLEPTNRGFLRGEFTDRYGKACSIQKSSLANEDCIWLGMNEGTHHHITGECMARMHLRKDMVKKLIPMLQRFVETGELD